MGEDEPQDPEPQDPMSNPMLAAKRKAFDDIHQFARGKMAAQMKSRGAPAPTPPPGPAEENGEPPDPTGQEEMGEGHAMQMPEMDLTKPPGPQQLPPRKGKLSVKMGAPVEEERVNGQGASTMHFPTAGGPSPFQAKRMAADAPPEILGGGSYMQENTPDGPVSHLRPGVDERNAGGTDQMLKNLSPEQLSALLAMVQKAQAQAGR